MAPFRGKRWAKLALSVFLFATMNSAHAAGPEQVVRFTDTVTPLGGKNLVPNGSFEVGSANWSSLGVGVGEGNSWAPLVDWGNFDRLHGEIVKSGASDGRSFLRIRLGGKHTPVFNFDYFNPVNRRQLSPLAASLGWIEVAPGQPYTLSLDMRASREDTKAAFGMLNEEAGAGLGAQRKPALQTVTLTRQWKRYSRTFTTKHPFLFVLAGPDLEREENVAVDVDAIQLERGAQATAFEPRNDLEIGITPTEPAGVFTVGKSSKLRIAAANSGSSPTHARITFQAADFADQPVELSGVSLEVPAKSAVEKLISLPTDWRGFYRVTAEWKIGDKMESRLLRIAIVPPRTSRETILGVNHAYPTAWLINLAEKAGVSWYRDWSLKWQHIEPDRGKFRWDISDPQMDRVAKRGHKLVAMFPFPSADWNSTAPDIKTLIAESPYFAAGAKGDSAELYVRARWAWSPRDANDLTAFLKTAVGRYQRQVGVWEFLNEPLYTGYSLPDDWVLKSKTIKGHKVDDYIKLLRAAAPAIRAANPRARIIGGPAVHPESAYNEMMFKAGVLDLVDIYGVHDYPGKAKPEARLPALEKLLADMKAHGGAKPMWMTEISYFGSDDLPRKPFVPIEGLWSETRLVTEKQVADYTVRYATMFLGRGGEKFFLHSGCTGSANHPGTESCLFADGAVRKVFPAMAVFTEMMGANPEFVGDKTNATAYIFAFETGKQATLVLWDSDEKTSARIPADVKCKNLMGRAVAGVAVKLSESPVYFIGRPGQARKLLASIQTN